MNRPYNRISENVLFALLLVALAVWMTGPVTADPRSTSAAGGSFAMAAAGHRS